MEKQDIRNVAIHLPTRRSIRLKGYGYSQPGDYFVTICSRNHAPLFGEIRVGEMVLNGIGQIVSEEWQKSVLIRKEIELDAWVVMPNHIHGIVIITQSGDVRAHGRAPLLQRSPRSLGSFIAGFKSSATKRINNQLNAPRRLIWHRNDYEHIIRDEKDLDIICQSITGNPAQWELDRDHPKSTRTDAKGERRQGFKITRGGVSAL